MAGRLTPYAANQLLNELTGKTNSLDFGTIYAGLSKTEPTVSGDSTTNITEPSTSGTGYKRVLIGSSSQALTQLMGSATGGSTTNNQIVKFDEVLASWGTLTHFVLFNSSSGGQALAFGNLVDDGGQATSITPTLNSMPIIRAGGLTISLT